VREHAQIEELLAVRELGGLEPDGERWLEEEMAAHSPCEECRRLERETAEAASSLAFALEPVAPSPELEARTVARAVAARTPIGPEHAERSDGSVVTIPRRRRAPWKALVGFAAAVAIFAGGWFVGSSSNRTEPFLFPHARVAAFHGSGGGSLALVYRPSGRGAVLVGSDLPAPRTGTTYELWLFESGAPVRAGCFTPAEGGAVVSFLDVSVARAAQAAVTEEPAACPSAPSTTPIFQTTL
jgi:hypothetical protein